ncbi:hypothetical protein INR75_17100 [Zunongwangia sp. SCSIO 43204]|uniref:hypothetical protein n=1 Tax=Zunongwangia sp. SCSIO 43204 TaxID=2779359 RepID=UPI001CA848F7|nr:hypothetical protein [Zunongwangia sp. SCSIO 43204]UAB83870.1 hypothetical protein INR75_17100 [Zunongwangia sp. SCSIO 43204]
MNLVQWFFENAGLYFFYELAVAIIGTYFYFYQARGNVLFKCLMIFFWWTWFADSFAKYAAILYLNEYKMLDVRNTIFERDGWIYNLVHIVSIVFYTWFFNRLIPGESLRKIVKYLGIFVAVVSLILLFISDDFWIVSNADVAFVKGLMIILFCVLCFLGLISSDQIISFYKFFGFYFTIGIFVFYLLTTPLFIYTKYFTWDSYDFSMLRIFIVKSCNVVLYSLCIIGYLVAMKHKDLNLKYSKDAT